MSDLKNVKKKAILDAAFNLFIENGYSNTKIIDIAKAAGIGKGTVYEYFASKEALLLELLQLQLRNDLNKMELAVHSSLNPKEKLKKFLALEIDSVHSYGSSICIVCQQLITSHANVSSEIIKALHGVLAVKYSYLYEIISEGLLSKDFKNVNASMATTALMGSISFYLSFKFDIIPNHSRANLFSLDKSSWNDDDFFDLVFNGLSS